MIDPRDGEPTLVAHRGFAGENPENTVAAFEAATEPAARERSDATEESGPRRRRADWIEVDVVPTVDGDVVAAHDAELGRRDGDDRPAGLTDATGVVWETDTATVTSAPVLESGETVPLFADVLDAVPADVGVNVELKNPGRWDIRPGEKLGSDALAERTAVWRPFVERVLAVVDDHENDCLFSSFCEGALAAVTELSAAPVAPLVSESIDDGLAIARQHDADAIHPPIDAIRGTPFFDADAFGHANDIVAVAHADERAVNVWTVETWYQADRLASAGVDGIIADYSTVQRR
ncbi:glycerophosphodiester phosphodiesterase [Halorubrum laminariae]|uniref:Glycerophosphodiester phosphodiesterase n=1 Tax=Halorubrum laminariae TaxID=1433523 RepID=A0ABD6C612_9EURY|nr:glycerophosphodiester phosphodiesterase [Halorubrum laminariae]